MKVRSEKLGTREQKHRKNDAKQDVFIANARLACFSKKINYQREKALKMLSFGD
ncbi:MAG: hypothetical protein AAB404_02590 [Patescibacteria group bacterium]